MRSALTKWGTRYVQRCREYMDQCKAGASVECVKVPDRYAWECPVCGRQYSAMENYAVQYREEVPA